MNQSLRKQLRKLVPCVGLIALAGSPMFAQTGSKNGAQPAGIVAPTVPGQLRQDQIVVNRRTPKIKFVPFAVVDPKTSKPAACGVKLQGLPGGKSMEVCQYWKEMNRWEEQLTELGYTLRPTGVMSMTPARIPLQQIPTNTVKLDQQARQFSASLLPNTPFRPANLAQALQQHKNLISIDPGLLNTVGGVLRPLTLKEAKTYNFNFGDPSVLSVFLNGNLELDGTSTATTFDAEAVAGGSMFSHSFNVLQLSGKLNAPNKGQLNLSVTASVLGQSVYNVSQSAPSTLSKSDIITKHLDESTTVGFSILFVPMTAKIGVQGTAGLSYGVTVAPVKAAGNIVPTINTSAYGQVSADVGVGSAGVSAKLTVLNLNGNLVGDVAIVPDAKNRADYSYDAQYCQTIDALDGSLVAFLDIGICPFCKELDSTLFSYQGIKSDGCVFNESKKTPVFEQTVSTPGR